MSNPKPRQSETGTTPPPQTGVPSPIPAGVQDHNFVAQAVFDLNKQVAKLEVSLEHIESRLAKVEEKVDGTKSDVTSIKAMVDALRPIAKSIGRGVWAIVILVVGAMLTTGGAILGLWLKHKMGW